MATSPLLLLDARDLKESGIAKSWTQIKKLQQQFGFPLGRMVRHLRKWTAEEVGDWLANCPSARHSPVKGAAKTRRGRPPKQKPSEADRQASVEAPRAPLDA
jgi:hypothetical protein